MSAVRSYVKYDCQCAEFHKIYKYSLAFYTALLYRTISGEMCRKYDKIKLRALGKVKGC